MDSTALTTIEQQRGIAQVDDVTRLAGAIADHSAAVGAFGDYKRRKAANTVRRQVADLALFARFLDLAKAEAVAMKARLTENETELLRAVRAIIVTEMQAVCERIPGGATCEDIFEWLDLLDLVATVAQKRELFAIAPDTHITIAEIATFPVLGNLSIDPSAWAGVTWGLVERFREWQLSEGYAIGSINVRISSVKVYATLAAKAGAIDAQGLALIKTVQGYRRGEGQRVDSDRDATRRVHAGGQTVKKSTAVLFSSVQAAQLKDQPTNTPRGRRDRLLLALLLEHGLRVSEAAILEVSHFDLGVGILSFYRPKTDKHERHELTKAALKAAKLYFKHDAPPIGKVFLASRSRGASGTLGGSGMSIRAMRQRVKVLGQRAGIEGLSPHDLRHHLATRLGETYTTKRLMEIFGWNSPAMAVRYQADGAVVVVED